MLRESPFIERFLNLGRKLIPRPVFEFFQPWYHGLLALSGAMIFGLPSRRIKVIGVTGSKGKSTTVFLITKFLEEPGSRTSGYGSAVQAGGSGSFTTGEAGYKVAAIGSLGYKIGDKEWPNNLKMTMPGRWKTQKFLAQAVKAGCRFAVLEVTSEGIKQKRHWGIKFDAAVFTNLEKEHIESHGSFENYYQAKQELFKGTRNIHILNGDSPYVELFSKFPARKKVFYSLPPREHSEIKFHTHLIGDFNFHNILAAVAVVREYEVSREAIQKALDKIKSIPGRLEFIETGQPFKVVVDYAHTPGSLEAVYRTLKELGVRNLGVRNQKIVPNSCYLKPKLICVLGAAGGGRDKWKRPVLGKIAAKYCDQIILTNEDPYDENPEEILDDVYKGIQNVSGFRFQVLRILDRREAIKKAMIEAGKNDIVVITGKGSETSIAVAGGKKIPWSDKGIVLELLNELKK